MGDALKCHRQPYLLSTQYVCWLLLLLLLFAFITDTFFFSSALLLNWSCCIRPGLVLFFSQSWSEALPAGGTQLAGSPAQQRSEWHTG